MCAYLFVMAVRRCAYVRNIVIKIQLLRTEAHVVFLPGKTGICLVAICLCICVIIIIIFMYYSCSQTAATTSTVNRTNDKTALIQ